jgi:hypothetical protein
MSSFNFTHLSRETLEGMLEDFAKNWLAHDGLWFLAVENAFGMETALKLDAEAWETFTKIEAKRIMARHNIPENSGLEGLKKALGFRLYSVLNKQTITDEGTKAFVFKMVDCRVQAARKRKNLPPFPCKSVGLVEYSEFAKTIDPRIHTECLACPPDEQDRDFWCGWKFWLE